MPLVKGSYYLSIPEPKEHGTRFVSTNLPDFWVGGVTMLRPDDKHQLSNVVASQKRAGFRPPVPDMALMAEFLQFVRDKIVVLYEKIEDHEWMTFEEWLEQTPYERARKDELKQIYVDFCSEFDPSNHDMAGVESFIKDEPYGKFAAPRWISARAELFKCLFGPFVQTMMNRVMEDEAFIKKIPTRERAKYIREMEEDGFCYVAMDATSYEAHFRGAFMKIRHMLMFHLADLPFDATRVYDETYVYKRGGFEIAGMTLPELLNVICDKQTLKMKSLGSIFTEMILCSGEMDTSLGNTFTTKAIVCFCMEKHGVDWRTRRHVCEGDDSLAPFKIGRIPTEEFVAKLGFLVKILCFEEVGQASFCGQLFDDQSMTVVTDPLEVLAKFGWTNKKYVSAGPKLLRGLLKSKLLSIACEYGNNPILWMIAKRGLELVGHVNVRDSIIAGMDLYEKQRYLLNVKKNPHDYITPPTDSSRVFVYENFGVTIDEQLMAEEVISRSKGMIDLSFLEFNPVWKDYFERYSQSDRTEFFGHPDCRKLCDKAKDLLMESARDEDEFISHRKLRRSVRQAAKTCLLVEKLYFPTD